jgi:hypothetical protein
MGKLFFERSEWPFGPHLAFVVSVGAAWLLASLEATAAQVGSDA